MNDRLPGRAALSLTLAIVIGLLGTAGSLTGQGDDNRPARFWQADLAGGSFVVEIDEIVAISQHRYIVDAQAIVDEVTITTNGATVTRFYHLTPLPEQTTSSVGKSLVERAKSVSSKIANRTGAKDEEGTFFWEMVQKNYPASTHAHTIEYRLDDIDQLNALYRSVYRFWVRGRVEKFSAK